jgi:NTP pyrophosphatase (non-canonical NTP hydrolase)
MHMREFQEMMRHLYFHRDSKRGVKGTYDWLVEEVEELGESLKGNDRKAMENEFADAVAWLASLANVVDVDLEKSTLGKYASKCPKCGHAPCQCNF